MAKNVRQSVTMTPRQAEWLMKEADRLGVSVSDLIRRIIDAHMEKRE